MLAMHVGGSEKDCRKQVRISTALRLRWPMCARYHNIVVLLRAPQSSNLCLKLRRPLRGIAAGLGAPGGC